MAGIGESMFAREPTRIGEKETRRLGDKETCRIYPDISPTPDKPGCKQWISNPCDPDALNYLPSIPEINIKPPEIGDEEKRRHGDKETRRKGEKEKRRRVPNQHPKS
jgi:hypothetical protein